MAQNGFTRIWPRPLSQAFGAREFAPIPRRCASSFVILISLLALGYCGSKMDFHRIWVKQCRATRTIRRRFGVKSALDYLIADKLVSFATEADRRPEFAMQLPHFQAAVWKVFNAYEIAGYLMSLRPKQRKALQQLLYVS